MFIKNIKKSSPHAPGRNYIFIVSQLPHFCSDNFGYTHPTRNPYHKRQTEYICLSKNGLQKNNRQKIRNAQQDLCCPHEQHIQPIRCHAAYRTKYDCNTGRYHSCCNSDKQRLSSAVPDHGKNITPHSICSKQKFFTWSNCIIFQIHVRRIFCHDSIAEQTATHDQYQNDDRQPWNRIIPSVFFFRYLLFCKLWFYSNNFKQVTHSYPPPAFPTAC